MVAFPASLSALSFLLTPAGRGQLLSSSACAESQVDTQIQTATDRYRKPQTDTDSHRQPQTDTDTDTDSQWQIQTATDRYRHRYRHTSAHLESLFIYDTLHCLWSEMFGGDEGGGGWNWINRKDSSYSPVSSGSMKSCIVTYPRLNIKEGTFDSPGLPPLYFLRPWYPIVFFSEIVFFHSCISLF